MITEKVVALRLITEFYFDLLILGLVVFLEHL